jgi:hypothetical protein
MILDSAPPPPPCLKGDIDAHATRRSEFVNVIAKMAEGNRRTERAGRHGVTVECCSNRLLGCFACF